MDVSYAKKFYLKAICILKLKKALIHTIKYSYHYSSVFSYNILQLDFKFLIFLIVAAQFNTFRSFLCPTSFSYTNIHSSPIKCILVLGHKFVHDLSSIQRHHYSYCAQLCSTTLRRTYIGIYYLYLQSLNWQSWDTTLFDILQIRMRLVLHSKCK